MGFEPQHRREMRISQPAIDAANADKSLSEPSDIWLLQINIITGTSGGVECCFYLSRFLSIKKDLVLALFFRKLLFDLTLQTGCFSVVRST